MIKKYKHTPQRMRESVSGQYVHIETFNWLQTCKESSDSNLKLEEEKCIQLYEDNQKLYSQLNKFKKENTYHWVGLVFITLVSITINILN